MAIASATLALLSAASASRASRSAATYALRRSFSDAAARASAASAAPRARASSAARSPSPSSWMVCRSGAGEPAREPSRERLEGDAPRKLPSESALGDAGRISEPENVWDPKPEPKPPSPRGEGERSDTAGGGGSAADKPGDSGLRDSASASRAGITDKSASNASIAVLASASAVSSCWTRRARREASERAAADDASAVSSRARASSAAFEASEAAARRETASSRRHASSSSRSGLGESGASLSQAVPPGSIDASAAAASTDGVGDAGAPARASAAAIAILLLVPRPEHRDIALQRLDVLREFLLRERLRGERLGQGIAKRLSLLVFCDIADEEGRGGSARADIAAAAAAAAVASAAASCVRTSESAAFEAAASAGLRLNVLGG